MEQIEFCQNIHDTFVLPVLSGLPLHSRWSVSFARHLGRWLASRVGLLLNGMLAVVDEAGKKLGLRGR